VYIGGGWHDCIGFDCIRYLYSAKGREGEFVNLAAHVPPGTMHPMANSEPGRFIHHLKGNRKEIGQLKKGDLVGEAAR